MLTYFLEGARAGLILSLLAGPLLVLLIQMSLRRGTLASFAAALGIWSSDTLIMLTTYFGFGGLRALLNASNFYRYVGSFGAVVLVIVAVAMWLREPPDLEAERVTTNRRGLFSAYLQGFAVNTFNPFTLFFWSAFTLTQVHDRDLSTTHAYAIYTGILAAIVITDSAKVLGARKLRNFLQPQTLLKVQRAGAVALGIFGVALALRSWW